MSTYERFVRLIRCTAVLIRQQRGELELDDIEQTLWLRVCRVVPRFDPSRGMTLERYVFMATTDAKKDILKRPRRKHSSLDEIRDRERSGGALETVSTLADWFDQRFVSQTDPGFGAIEVADLIDTLPLSDFQKTFLRLRVAGLWQSEAGHELDGGDGWRVAESIRRAVGGRAAFMRAYVS